MPWSLRLRPLVVEGLVSYMRTVRSIPGFTLLPVVNRAIVEGFATEAVLQKCGDAEDVGGDGV